LKKKVDDKKFAEMWLAGVPARQIAEEFNIHIMYVYEKRNMLNLPARQIREQNEQKIIDFIKQKGGYCYAKELSDYPAFAIQRLVAKKVLFKVKFCLHRGTGGYERRLDHSLVFKEPFIRKTYYCLGRTGVVRLLSEALKKPQDPQTRKVISNYLRRYLTHAERVAVLWKLGIRSFHLLKGSIQIDSVVFPRRGVSDAATT
jgi:hypothetical protein